MSSSEFSIQCRIQDADRAWTFLISEEERDLLNKNILQLYWDQHQGWCLVTRYQRQLLMETNRHGLNDITKHLYLYGQRSWEEWSTVRCLSDPDRQFREIKRHAVLKKRKELNA